MAELPDINTTETSYIAYWNALDHGAVDISPAEVTSHPGVVDYTLYDNGIEGTFDLVYTSNTYLSVSDSEVMPATFRVKTDGWIVVYLDQTENYAAPIEMSPDYQTPRYTQGIGGWWNVEPRWVDWAYNFNGNNNVLQDSPVIVGNGLSRGVNLLRQELSNSGVMTFNHSDVGLYDYMDSDSTATTVLSAKHTGGVTSTASFTFADGTTIDNAVMTCGAYSGANNRQVQFRFEGDQFFDSDSIGNPDVPAGTYDPDPLLTEPAAEYDTTIDEANGNDYHNGVWGITAKWH